MMINWFALLLYVHRRRRVGAWGAQAPPIIWWGVQSTPNIIILQVNSRCQSTKLTKAPSKLCEAMNTNSTYKSMLSEVQESLRLYLTIPITSATSEISFSALRRVLTYLRSTMTEQQLNHCLLLYKHITDSLDIKSIAKEFIATS